MTNQNTDIVKIIENLYGKPDSTVKEKPPQDPCLHNSCSKCRGTGVDDKGRQCVHMISCPCSACNPYSM